jgi:hypothetical protein
MCFWIENQKVILFPIFMKNGCEAATSALSLIIFCQDLRYQLTINFLT